jgi:pimeloyl-ACP methyl ester carboxylesterase
MKETCVSFGEKNHLSGILCEPDAKDARKDAPPVLMWNVGIQHHVGPYRIWVDAARQLARAGFASLRFDLGGMGDSEPGRNGPAENVADAMGFLEKRLGAKRFALTGFCSGVDQLHTVGVADPRVVAMAYLEGWAYRTRAFWMRYPLRFLSAPRWENRIKRRLSGLKRFARSTGVMDPVAVEYAGGAATMFDRQPPTRTEYGRDLNALADRGVKLLLVYAGHDSNIVSEGQLDEMLGPGIRQRLELVLLGGADHIFYRVEDRLVAVSTLVSWLQRCYP